jgi:hypothetical protein
MRTLRKLRINGKPVKMVGNQLVLPWSLNVRVDLAEHLRCSADDGETEAIQDLRSRPEA